MTQDITYFEQGYIDNTYFVYTADVASETSSEFTMTATCGVIRHAAVELTVEFTQRASITHINGIDIFALTSASMDVSAKVIRNNNVAASSAFSISTQFSRVRYISSDEYAATALDVIFNSVSSAQAAFEAASSLSGDNAISITVAGTRTRLTLIGNINA